MSQPPLPDSYEDLFHRAQTASRRGDTETAIALCSRLLRRLSRLSTDILARRPELRDLQLSASLQLSELLRSQGRYAEVIEVVEGLLKSHPEEAKTWRRDIAVMCVAKGEVEKGLGELRALADEEPDNVWNWLALGNEARVEGWHAESEAALRRAVEVAQQKGDTELLAEAYYSLFRLFEAMGRVDDALAAWEGALFRNPEAHDTIREVHRMLIDAGRYAQAQAYIARDKNRLRARFYQGMLAELTGNPARARQEWQSVAAMDPLQFESGQDCWMEAVLRLGDPKPVIEKMQQFMRQHSSARMLTLWGIALAMLGEEERAQRAFEVSVQAQRRSRPPKQKLDAADWRLLNSLVKDDEIKAKLRRHFAVIERVWG